MTTTDTIEQTRMPTALAAAATMILFTTGRGTPLGFPVPTVKVASNPAMAALGAEGRMTS